MSILINDSWNSNQPSCSNWSPHNWSKPMFKALKIKMWQQAVTKLARPVIDDEEHAWIMQINGVMKTTDKGWTRNWFSEQNMKTQLPISSASCWIQWGAVLASKNKQPADVNSARRMMMMNCHVNQRAGAEFDEQGGTNQKPEKTRTNTRQGMHEALSLRPNSAPLGIISRCKKDSVMRLDLQDTMAPS